MDALDPILPELHEIAAHLQSEISAQDRSYRLKTYKKSFHGTDAVAWLIKNNYAQAPDQALALGNLLLSVGYIRSGFKDYAFHSNGLYSFASRDNMDQRRAVQLAQRDKVRTLEVDLRTTQQTLEATRASQTRERQITLVATVLLFVFTFSPNIYVSAFLLVLAGTIAYHSDLNTARVARKRKKAAAEQEASAERLSPSSSSSSSSSMKELNANGLIPSLVGSGQNTLVRGHRRSPSTNRRSVHVAVEDTSNLSSSNNSSNSNGSSSSSSSSSNSASKMAKSTSSCLLGVSSSSSSRPRTPSPHPKTPKATPSSEQKTPRVPSTPRVVGSTPRVASTPRGGKNAQEPEPTAPLLFFDSLSALIAYYDIEFSTSEEVYCACVVTDISLPNQPMVFVNNAFTEMTKYPREESLGKNCRFLQGPGTNKKDVQSIREIVNSRSEGFVKLLNYTKSGKPFINMLYLVPLRNKKGVIQFYLGCQTPISELEEESHQALTKPNAEAPKPAVPLTPLSESQVSRVRIHVKTEPQIVGPPNSKPLPFESEWFKGMFSMKSKTRENPDPYFADKNRMFEVQMQGVFKQPFSPTTQLWFGGELAKPMVLGRFKRTMAGLLLKFVSSFGRGLHFSFGDNESHGDHPHMTFPLLAAIDRCIITPPDGVPPVLGDVIPDTPENKAFRRTSPSTGATFQVGPIYTLCFYSMYLDFEAWETCNLTGFSNMNLHTFWQDQKLTFIMYALDEKEVYHSVANRKIICQFDLSHEDDEQYRTESKS